MYSLRSPLVNVPLHDRLEKPTTRQEQGHLPFPTDSSVQGGTCALGVTGLCELVQHLVHQGLACEEIPLVDVQGGRGMGDSSQSCHHGSE